MSVLKNYFSFTKILQPTETHGEDNDTLGKLGPEPRSGHRIVVTNSNLYSLGGYNPDFWEYINETNETYYPLFKELWKFNFVTKKWKKLQTEGSMPLELASHSACICGNSLFIYGGTGIPFGEASSNRLHICNLKSLKWTHPSTEGEPPTRGYGSAVHIVDNNFYVFGGTTGWEYNSDVHKLNLETLYWEKQEPKGKIEPPPGRYRHESAVFNNKLYIFGGGRAQAVFPLEELPAFDLVTQEWECIHCRPDPKHGFPKARRCHTCVQFRQDVYICGGYNGEEIYGDIWKISTTDFTWQLIPSTLPQPCYFHSAAITPSGCMYIYGGVIVLDIERTSAITAIQLYVPSLREMCWTAVSSCMPDIENIPVNHLRELGIPTDLITRIH